MYTRKRVVENAVGASTQPSPPLKLRALCSCCLRLTAMKPKASSKRQPPASCGWIALGSILLLGSIAQCLAPAAGARKRHRSSYMAGGVQVASYPLAPEHSSSLITPAACHVVRPFAAAVAAMGDAAIIVEGFVEGFFEKAALAALSRRKETHGSTVINSLRIDCISGLR